MTRHEDYARGAGYDLRRGIGRDVVVGLHGLGADRTQPLGLLDGIDLEGATLLAPDARAHGTTPEIGDAPAFRFPALAKDLAALAARLELADRPVHLVGISMGAAIALRTALDARLDVRSLALIRPAFSDEASPPNLRVMAAIGETLNSRDREAARAAFARSADYRRVAQVSALGAESLLRQFDAPLAVERSERLRSVPRNVAYLSPGELAGLRVTTLVVGTDRDPVHPLSVAEEWHRGIPHSDLVVVPPRDDDPAGSLAATRAAVGSHLARVLPSR